MDIKKKAPITRDYFAEMYVAGVLADNDWNVYFPRRDKGFDFIITKEVEGKTIIRPVQVKGKYPEKSKTDKRTYGYKGKLTAIHKNMILAIPFFSTTGIGKSPLFTAFMPFGKIVKMEKRYRCEPALFKDGKPLPRRDYKKYFDLQGIL